MSEYSNVTGGSSSSTPAAQYYRYHHHLLHNPPLGQSSTEPLLPPLGPSPALRQQRQSGHAAVAAAGGCTESPHESSSVQARRAPLKSASMGAKKVNATAGRRDSSKLNTNGQPKRKRTKTGCWTCRRRKIKCDEQYPGCKRCAIARLECEGYGARHASNTPSSTVASAGTSAASSPSATAPPVVTTGRSAQELAQQHPLSPVIECTVNDASCNHHHPPQIENSPQNQKERRSTRHRQKSRPVLSRANSAESRYVPPSIASTSDSCISRYRCPCDAVGYGTPFCPASATSSSHGGESIDHCRDWNDIYSPDSTRNCSPLSPDYQQYFEEAELVEVQHLSAEPGLNISQSLPTSLEQGLETGAGRGLPALTLTGVNEPQMHPSLTLSDFTFEGNDNSVKQASRCNSYNNTGPLSAPLLSGHQQQPFFSTTSTQTTELVGSRPVSPLLFGNMPSRSPIPNFSLFNSIPGLSYEYSGGGNFVDMAFAANPPQRTHSLPVTPSDGPMLNLPSTSNLSRLSPIPSLGNSSTHLDFDSLFNFVGPQGNFAADPNPTVSNHWNDQEGMMRMFSSNGSIGHDFSVASSLPQILGKSGKSVSMLAVSTPGLTASSILSPLPNCASTLTHYPQAPLPSQDWTVANRITVATASRAPLDRSNSISNTGWPRGECIRKNAPNSPASDPSTIAFNRAQVDNEAAAQCVCFAPQPAIDPLLATSISAKLQRCGSEEADKHGKPSRVHNLVELDRIPPLILRTVRKDWSIPSNMQEKLNKMENVRHVELLQHYFISTCPLFTNIDHPHNPFRTFVAEHVTESMPMLYAVLAIASINQAPLSVAARAESLLYFESSVDCLVRALEQQDDVSLFTLLFLSLYYAFDAGTQQSQHFSRRAHRIINDRLDRLKASSMAADPDFRFLVRLHVWYEVVANLARRPGNLRDMPAGEYDLTTLIHIIEQWDALKEQSAGLSSVHDNYVGLGLQGVPTFFISLLNEVTVMKEEQYNFDTATAGSDASPVPKTRHWEIKLCHARRIRDLESKLQFARPGRLYIPSAVANESHLHRAVSVRFFDLFRLAASIHLLTELQGLTSNSLPIQLRVTEIVDLLSNIEQNSTYNISGIWAFFIAGAAAMNHAERRVLQRRLESTWHAPCGNVWTLRSILEECWERNEEASESGRSLHTWKEVALSRGWTLLLM